MFTPSRATLFGMTEVWPAHHLPAIEKPPEKTPWDSIERHVPSRCVLLAACKRNEFTLAEKLLSRMWNMSNGVKGLTERVRDEFNGSSLLFAQHLSAQQPTLSSHDMKDAFAAMQFERLRSSSENAWKVEPELNFSLRSLLLREGVTPQQIVSIVDRMMGSRRFLTIDKLKQFIQRNGSRQETAEILKKEATPIAPERLVEIEAYLDDMIRLTPEKEMSPWMQNDRARTLAAILLSNPSVSLTLIVRVLKEHCRIPSLQVSAFHRPLERWKKTSLDTTEDPRASFANALCRDCERYNPRLYTEMIPIARASAEKNHEMKEEIRNRKSEGTKRGLLPSRIKRLQARIHSALEDIRTPDFTMPPLTKASEKRLEDPDFSAFMEKLRSQDFFAIAPHIRVHSSRQAYRERGFVVPEIQVHALTVDFNLEGGTASSRNEARNIQKLFKEEMGEQREIRTFTTSTSLLHSMLKRAPESDPILRCDWREAGSSWKQQRAEGKRTVAEKDARRFQVPLTWIERSRKKEPPQE